MSQASPSAFSHSGEVGSPRGSHLKKAHTSFHQAATKAFAAAAISGEHSTPVTGPTLLSPAPATLYPGALSPHAHSARGLSPNARSGKITMTATPRAPGELRKLGS